MTKAKYRLLDANLDDIDAAFVRRVRNPGERAVMRRIWRRLGSGRPARG